MTGPEHYTAAERLAVDAQSIEAAGHASDNPAIRNALDRQHARIAARGQLHATLALAAATAKAFDPDVDFETWREVTE